MLWRSTIYRAPVVDRPREVVAAVDFNRYITGNTEPAPIGHDVQLENPRNRSDSKSHAKQLPRMQVLSHQGEWTMILMMHMMTPTIQESNLIVVDNNYT